jgi:uncharacterized protein (TIGR02444 family)
MNNYLELGLHSKIAFPLFLQRVYAKKGVKSACLSLQDKYSLNSNILVFCCWLASQNYSKLTEKDILEIIEKIKPWNEKIVQGLRRIRKIIARKYLDDKFDKLFNTVVENELFAERIERTLIAQALGEIKRDYDLGADKVSRALKNIFSYAKSQNINIHKVDLEKIYCIVGMCFEH